MREGIVIRGRFQVFAIPGNEVLTGAAFREQWRRGRIRTRLDQHNLIVDQGLQAIAVFLGGNANSPTVGGSGFADLSDITIGEMDLGNTPTPPAPADSDTSSVGALVYTPVLTVTYPSATSITFSGVVPITELVGTTITEEALKMVSGKVFAKVKLATPQLLDGSSAYQFSHTITFARA